MVKRADFIIECSNEDKSFVGFVVNVQCNRRNTRTNCVLPSFWGHKPDSLQRAPTKCKLISGRLLQHHKRKINSVRAKHKILIVQMSEDHNGKRFT